MAIYFILFIGLLAVFVAFGVVMLNMLFSEEDEEDD